MKAELLVVGDCPHTAPTAALLRGALDGIGLAAVSFTTTVIETAEQAEARGFLGSPTIMVNGVDIFPDPGRQPGLTCRLYPRVDGATTGVPDLRNLRKALKRVAAPLLARAR